MIARVVAWCARAQHARWFRTGTMAAIVVNAVLIGFETDDSLAEGYAGAFAWAHGIILALFCAELAVSWRRTVGAGPRSSAPGGTSSIRRSSPRA